MENGSRPERPGITELVREYYAELYRFAYRLSGSTADAEDLVQQTFLITQKSLDQLRDPSSVRAWLYTVTRNSFLRTRRREQRVSVLSLADTDELVDNSEPPIEVDSEELQTVLNELPEEFRTPLVLFYFEDFSYKDIARQMDVPVGTIMSRLARAKQHLRSRLATEPVGSPSSDVQ